ncbi:unnamed protein product [Euphydryas editha]|uniref:RNA-directed DNA polymerase n=1 Tax=Euphydryas editha TaxID=104508 RepID=A0AAU9TQ39_EUPED|nr:unnamed protein product [Euphydryas editha]
MIDTGSTRSFMSPRIAYKYFSEYIRHEPFQVISTHASSRHDETIVIPLLPTFNTTDYHKFHLYDVDERYEGLIGNNLLKQLDAIIDLKHLMLRTKTTCIPIINNLNYVIKLQPRTEQRVKIPTDIYSGEAIVNFVEFTPGLRMPSALVNCVNGYALTVIQNTLEVPYTITITKPFTVMKYDMTECKLNFSDHNTTIDTNKLLRDNLQRLRLDHMNDEERSKILNLCNEYKDIFYCDQIPLSFTNQVKHKIRTKNEDPIYVRPYRQAPSQAAEINRQIEKLLKDNVIQESHSPWNAPVHLVPKKGDASGEIKWRMVIDYRRLNEITIDDRYPLPNITDLFDKLGKSLYFTTLDLASGYHQIEVEEQDREKTAFSTQNGHYEFLRMPFGLKTAPATFQRTMDNVLRGLQGLHCMVYLDDVIVFSTSLDEHIHKLRTVFDRLRQTNLKVQLDKSEFLRKEVIYLGHTITKDGLRPNDDKIAAVMNYPIPKTTTEIKSFLGLIGYYRRFIKDFAHVTKPLTSCLKKRNKIIMDQNYVDAFNRCKELLTHAPLLQYPDYDKTFILTTDASNVALGAVLSQGPIGSDKPVAYASRTLSDTEARYSTIERECLAIVWAIKHFRPYLYGRKFIIYTDHKPLAWLDSYKDTSSKFTRWRLRLQDFDYEIIYKKGNQNSNADALSRIKVNATNSDNEGHSMVVNVDNEKLTTKQRTERNDSSTLSISDTSATVTASSNPDLDSETISISSIPKTPEHSIRLPSETSRSDTIHSAIDIDSTGIPILQEAIDTKPNQLLIFTWLRNEMQVRDKSRDKQRILEVTLPTNNPNLIKQFLKEYINPKTKYFIYFNDKEHRKQFCSAVIELFRKNTVLLYECTERIVYVESESVQKEIVLNYHEGKTCHRGIKETLAKIRRIYFWHNMHETVSAIINACDVCRQMKYDRRPIKPMLQLTQTQDAPFQEIFIDLFQIEGQYFLTLIDAFSKLGQAIPIANRSTAEVVRALMKYFSFYGIPKKICSDPGSEFNNELMKEFLSLHKVEIHIGTPNNPNSMGVIERLHSTISEIYRCAKYEKKCTDVASVMTYSIISYNHSIHSATGLTPFEVVFGHTDSGSPFNVDFEKQYVQQLVKDHAKRTKFLYKYLTEKLLRTRKELGKRRVVKVKDNSPKEKPFSRKTLIKERVKISRVTLKPK